MDFYGMRLSLVIPTFVWVTLPRSSLRPARRGYGLACKDLSYSKGFDVCKSVGRGP